jgi:hypothetical protein
MMPSFRGQYFLDMQNLFSYSSIMNRRCLIEVTFTHLVNSAAIISIDPVKL